MFKRIFGSDCNRCGATFTKTEFEGLPTCETCLLKIRAERESDRPCPHCRTSMLKVIVFNIIVDSCPNGHGSWLDGGELELLQKAIKDAEDSGMATGFVLGLGAGSN